MDQLLEYFRQFNEYAKSNPLLAGVISLWGAGIVTWALRGVPLKIWQFIKRQSTTTLTLNNSTVGDNYETFTTFLAWLNNSKYVKYSRTLMIIGIFSNVMPSDKSSKSANVITSIGTGKHFFMFDGWPFSVELTETSPPAGYGTRNYEVKITTIGRDHKRIIDIIEKFKYVKNEDTLDMFVYKSDGWSRLKSIKPRNIDTVITADNIKEKLITDIEEFFNNEKWYIENGIPYKKIIFLHGKPGTGKSSLIKALAGYFQKDVYILNPNDVSDSGFGKALADVGRGNFVFIEDVEKSPGFQARSNMRVKVIKSNNEGRKDKKNINNTTVTANSDTPAIDSKEKEAFSFLTISGVLNAFDGVIPLDNVIIFLTTNIIEEIDAAILREGRTDVIMEIPELQSSDIRRYINIKFPDYHIPDYIEFDPKPGCSVQTVYMNNKNDPQAIMDTLKAKVQSDNVVNLVSSKH